MAFPACLRAISRAGRFSNVQRVSGSQVQRAGLMTGRVPLNPSASAGDFRIARWPIFHDRAPTRGSFRAMAGREPRSGRVPGRRQPRRRSPVTTVSVSRSGIRARRTPALRRLRRVVARSQRPTTVQRFGRAGFEPERAAQRSTAGFAERQQQLEEFWHTRFLGSSHAAALQSTAEPAIRRPAPRCSRCAGAGASVTVVRLAAVIRVEAAARATGKQFSS